MRSSLALGFCVGLVGASGCVVSVDSQGQIAREEKRFSVTEVPDVRLTTFDGSIEIRSWDAKEVLVEIEKRGATEESLRALEIRSTQDGNRVEVEVRRPSSEGLAGIGFFRGASARLTVSLPRHSNVQARTGDGSIRIEQVEGGIQLQTGDGSIRASELSGELVLKTGDGSVVVDRADGRLDVETGDGGVSVSGRISRARLHTGDGSIVFRADEETRIEGDWEITTGDGSVTLHMPSGLSAEIDAHTGDGSIRNELDLVVSGEDGRSRRTLRGRIGEGGPRLRIRTGDGAIRLLKT